MGALTSRSRDTGTAVDLYKAIRELHAEKKRLEEAIASLEELIEAKASTECLHLDDFKKTRRRGRKSMPPEERQEVSERMKKYWAQRRASVAKVSARSQS
jgi:hypothetical protein